jgi:cystathionine gamma-lyase
MQMHAHVCLCNAVVQGLCPHKCTAAQDFGRDTFDTIVAQLMGAEAALVRVQFFSGTHAIACALFGALRAGDKMLAVSGRPYDTLEEVIGLRPSHTTGGFWGSLKEQGVSYGAIDMLPGAVFDLDTIDEYLSVDKSVKLIHIQRSCGYQWRPSIVMSEIERLCDHINRKWKPVRDLIIFVDNCYGELVEDVEPCHVGADLCAGSLIKNLGGTLAPCGGYVAGTSELVLRARARLSAPGVDGGATLGQNRKLYQVETKGYATVAHYTIGRPCYSISTIHTAHWQDFHTCILQGLFLSPTIIGESMKGAMLTSYVLGNKLGFPCNPPHSAHRTDIIQAVQLGSRERVSISE